MNKEMINAVDSVAKQKEISPDTIFHALEESLGAVITKQISPVDQPASIEVRIDRESGETVISRSWEIVDDDHQEINPSAHVSLTEALKDYDEVTVGDRIEEKLESEKFSRISYHQAKQVLTRIVRDAKRVKLAESYRSDIGKIINGKVKGVTRDAIRVEVTEEVDGLLPRKNLIDREIFRVNDRICALLCDVSAEKGALLQLSRTHPQLVSELFRIEVPEIADGTIQVKGCSRDPGSRAKMAVKTNDSRIDPIGACIGMRGSRVQAVTNELHGERIDIILWDDDPAQLAIKALAPAKIKSIAVNEEDHTMDIAVEEEQIAQVIGRNGQNILLASQLVGWELNIMNEQDIQQKTETRQRLIRTLLIESLEIDEDIANIFIRENFSSIEDIAGSRIVDLAQIEEFDEDISEALIERAKQSLVSQAITGEQQQLSDLYRIPGITADIANDLIESNIKTVDDLAELATDELLEIHQMEEELAGKLIMAARANWFNKNESE